MSPTTKKIIKNIKSKQTIMGTIIAVLILTLAMLSSFIVILPQPVRAAYGDFSYYKEITIDYTKVNGTQTNFPVWFYNTSSDFASNILYNGSDIAFYDSTNSTQYNHEIEIWNKTSGELGVWVNVTSLSGTANTVIYMYYGDADVASNPGHNPESVWDGGFSLVHHLNGTSYGLCKDSTANNNDVVSEWGTITYNATGKVGTSVDMPGANTCLNISDSASISLNDTFTIEAWVYLDSWDQSYMRIMEKTGGTSEYIFDFRGSAAAAPICSPEMNWYQTNASTATVLGAANTVTPGCWYYVTATYNRTSSTGRMFLNGTLISTSSWNWYINDATNNFTISSADAGANRYWNGKIDELRLSIVNRSASWIMTSYNNTNSPSTFMTFGTQTSQGGTASSYSLKYDMGTQIEWAGTTGTTVWSNGSGTYLETMEINLSVNTTQNVTEIRVWVGDMNDTGLWVNASNISLYLSTDNSTYGLLGTYTDGGSNLSINMTTWNNVTMATTPFVYGGINGTNRSIYCRFKLTIPSTASTYNYFNFTTWRVYIGRYT